MLLDKCEILGIVKNVLCRIELRTQFCSDSKAQFFLQIRNPYIKTDMVEPSICVEQLSYEAIYDFKFLLNGSDYLADAK